jgi:hypothetical protein
MASVQHAYQQPSFRIIHPLDDVREAKCTGEGLGPIEMNRSVRLSLMILRGYLMGMMLMLLYHVLDMAGAFHTLR